MGWLSTGRGWGTVRVVVGRQRGREEIRLAAPGSPVRLARLGVRHDVPVLVISGSTAHVDATDAERLLPALKVAVAVAADKGAAVVTGGTDAGVFHLLGLALSSAPRRPGVVVGVAPDGLVADVTSQPGDGKVPVDPQLTALVRVPGSGWGDETATLSRLVGEMAGSQPAVVLLAGGGDVTRVELVEHLSRGRAVVVLAGSGRLADDVAAGSVGDTNSDLRALVSSGEVRIVPSDGGSAELSGVLDELLEERRRRSPRQRIPPLTVMPRFRFRPEPPRPLLAPGAAVRYPALRQRLTEADGLVYPAFVSCDNEAQLEQNRYRWFIVLAIVGGLLTTTFGAVQAWLQSAAWPGVVVATLGAATSGITTVARRQGSLHNYLSARIRAERLRSLYFEYLVTPPESGEAKHREQVRDLQLRVAELESGPVTS
jgi:SLOG in TRPM, prokaryote